MTNGLASADSRFRQQADVTLRSQASPTPTAFISERAASCPPAASKIPRRRTQRISRECVREAAEAEEEGGDDDDESSSNRHASSSGLALVRNLGSSLAGVLFSRADIQV